MDTAETPPVIATTNSKQRKANSKKDKTGTTPYEVIPHTPNQQILDLTIDKPTLLEKTPDPTTKLFQNDPNQPKPLIRQHENMMEEAQAKTPKRKRTTTVEGSSTPGTKV